MSEVTFNTKPRDAVYIDHNDGVFKFIDGDMVVSRGGIATRGDIPQHVYDMLCKYVESGHIYPFVYMTSDEYVLAKLRNGT